MMGRAMLLTLQTATTLTVGPGRDHATISAALAAAQPGDTVRVFRGEYHERPVIRHPVVLLGEPGAVLDGDGQGVVLTVLASATIRGLTIRGSGSDQSREHSGILAVGAEHLRIDHNRLEDVLFGVYLKQCDRAAIVGNHIEGNHLPIPLRGDGIRLWYSHKAIIEANTVRRVRDVVIWFSDSVQVRANHVSESRYGLHYMYSDHNVFEANEFLRNDVGAFIMYSNHITFRGNVFADARGTTGRGLGFKDADNIYAEHNVLVKNAVGISMDNSPSSRAAVNAFRDNVIAYNDVGVALLPSVRDNVFVRNRFIDNVEPVRVTGGGSALANRWTENYWSEYAGFDAERDGFGDTPFVLERLSDDLLAKHERLRIFNLSLAATALDLLGRVFPLLTPQPVVVDSLPWRDGATPIDRTRERGGWLGAIPFLFVSAATIAAIPWLKRAGRGR